MWPGSHREVYYAHEQELNWVPTERFPEAVERVKRTIQPVQMVGDIGDCVFTHHRVLHSGAGASWLRLARMLPLLLLPFAYACLRATRVTANAEVCR